MRTPPRQGGSITRQVALIVLGSLFLAHVLSAIVWVRFAPPPPSIQILASRIDLTARMALATAVPDRDALVAAATQSGLATRIARALPPGMGDASWHGAPLLREALAAEPGRPALDIVFGPPSVPASSRATAAISLGNGTWMLFAVPAFGDPGVDAVWFAPLVDLLFGAMPLALLSIWAARRVTGPLVRLAQAAEHVATIDDPLPLPEAGTREIRQVARALNGLIGQLRLFVTDRTRMLAAISHDLRTPLTRLRLRAEGIPDPVARDKMLLDIVRMDAMISSTLAFIRNDALEERIEPVDIAVLVVTVCDAFADAGSDVTYSGPLHLAGACRPQAMERALNNLIDNALKFGGGARVTLHAPPAAGSAPEEAIEAVIDVEDHGPGIPASQRAEVLKPFTRGDASRRIDRGGVGLGLAITHSIIQRHGGSIELLDGVPHGLLARVRLPVPPQRGWPARLRPEAMPTNA